MRMAKTYLYSYGSGPYGASTTRRDRAYIEARPAFAVLEPEFRNRLFALADDVIEHGGDFGFGGGGRSQDEQYNLFKQRYLKRSTAASGWFWWDGRPLGINDYGYWQKKSGVASAAPPGSSYHESTTQGGKGYALAADMVGDHKLGNALAAKHGLKHFANVNSEPWHYQPIEIPNARREYTGKPEPLPVWGQPDVLPPLGEDMRAIRFRPKGYADQLVGFSVANPEQLIRLGMDTEPMLVVPFSAADIKKIESELGIKLTPYQE